MAKLKPYYKQIADELEQDILNHKFRPGSRMPTELAIQKRFFVSRMTVRQAYRLLAAKGAAVIVKNKGVFVKNTKIQKGSGVLSYTDLIAGNGLIGNTKVIQLERCLPDEKTAEMLNLKTGEKIYLLKRYRYVKNELVVIEVAHLNAKYVPDFDKFNLNNNSLYDVLCSEYNLCLEEVHEEISAELLTDEEARLMIGSRHCPVLRINTVSFLDNGDPIEYTIQYCNYKVFSYEVINKDIPRQYCRRKIVESEIQ